MAKSTRSKWKKLHRRQRAQEAAATTAARITRLHEKLELTVHGGIAAVPPQDPETRFHFVNPELDPRVPNTRKDLNNNYRAELNHVTYDYTKPLRLPPPRTNVYGKSQPDAPHPMTYQYETVDADAPIAGRALTKEDMQRIAARQQQQQQQQVTRASNKNDDDDEEEAQRQHVRSNKAAAAADKSAADMVDDAHDDDDEPEEYVFGLDDAAPRKVRKAAHKAKHAKKAVDTPTTAAAAAAPVKIASMREATHKNKRTVAATATRKMKRVGAVDGAAAAASTRVVRSSSSSSKKKKSRA